MLHEKKIKKEERTVKKGGKNFGILGEKLNAAFPEGRLKTTGKSKVSGSGEEKDSEKLQEKRGSEKEFSKANRPQKFIKKGDLE